MQFEKAEAERGRLTIYQAQDMTVDPLSGKLFGMTPIPRSLLEPAANDPVTGAVTDVLPPGVNIQPTVTAALSALDLDHLVRVVGQRL